MKRFNWLVLAFGTMAFASVALVGCGGDDEVTGCETNTDCPSGEFCVNGTCAQACETADDCANPDQVCSGACPELDRPICFFECTTNDDCGLDQFCNLDFCNGAFGRCEATTGGCTDNDDCGDGEVCDLDAGECVLACTEHADCDEDFLCNINTGFCIAKGADCVTDDDCGDGQVCEDDVCVDSNACEETADCYARGNFFCDEGAGECADTSCGQPGNTCERCVLGPNDGDRADNGPVIYLAEQIDLPGDDRCQPDSDKCGEGAKLYCEFSFFFFDPDGDFTPANANLFVISGGGNFSTTFGVAQTGSGIGKFGACFGTDQTTPGTAIFVRDEADNASNTLCTNGLR